MLDFPSDLKSARIVTELMCQRRLILLHSPPFFDAPMLGVIEGRNMAT
jgi:hypothetical protein